MFEKFIHLRADSALTNGCDIDHRLRTLYRIFVVFAESPVAAEPCKCPFHNPRQTDNFEGTLLPFDDLQLPAVVPQQLACELAASWPASAITVSIPGYRGLRPASKSSPACRSEMLAGSTRFAMGSPSVSTRI